MQILLTKDGRQTGNAILIRRVTDSPLPEEVYLCETDFGNRMRLTKKEIERRYWPGELRSYEQWRADRQQIQNDNEGEDWLEENLPE